MLVVAEAILHIAVPEPITIRFAQDTQELQQLQLDRFGGVLINASFSFCDKVRWLFQYFLLQENYQFLLMIFF